MSDPVYHKAVIPGAKVGSPPPAAPPRTPQFFLDKELIAYLQQNMQIYVSPSLDHYGNIHINTTLNIAGEYICSCSNTATPVMNHQKEQRLLDLENKIRQLESNIVILQYEQGKMKDPV